MRLGIMLSYAIRKIEVPMELIRAADEMGVYALWMPEAWGGDAVTFLAWIGSHTKNVKLGTAILQMPARTPANTAMIAMSMNQLSGGRFLLGMGVSGPQVAEGWHGASFSRPLQRTREYVSIVRAIFQRQSPLVHQGEIYRIPYDGPDATGLGKPLKSLLRPDPDIPIYLAALGPKNVALTAEIADGWLPVFFSPDKYEQVFGTVVNRGLARGGKELSAFDIAPAVPVAIHDDLEKAYDLIRPLMALYLGGMGAKGRNFYNDLAVRYGYEAAAAEIQELYLSGRQREAIKKVPEALIDDVGLAGPKARVRERLTRWMDSQVTTLNATLADQASFRPLVELFGEIS